ncbi:zinc-dependent peptidase [Aureivirga sp. CE67]|uniref:M90 family metallopeptidase n=1 Tax=Aureivirga sp. CE67 TaxID=1788983 RepID=UPI0018CA09EC|nr:M90 family metallopeptidase [Aureivirga sp. CE67]
MKILSIIFILSVFLLIFFRFRKKRELKKREELPMPEAWKEMLEKHVRYYQKLSPELKVEFQKRVMFFLANVKVIGVKTEVDDLDKILVAAGAIIPIFAFPKWQYSYLEEVLIYPKTFDRDRQFTNKDSKEFISGVVGTGGHLRSVMILSKPALHHGFDIANDKQNVAIHEFLHLLDREDYEVNGVPEILIHHKYSALWMEYIRKNIKMIHENKSDIRSYGGTNPAEFFAVIGEYFFEQPQKLKREHPKLYALLKDMFKQIPLKENPRILPKK